MTDKCNLDQMKKGGIIHYEVNNINSIIKPNVKLFDNNIGK